MAREFSKRFYRSKEWENARDYALKRDNYLCVRCGAPAEEVHHIIHLSPKNIDDPTVTVNPDNLASLCKSCHFETHEEDWQERLKYGRDMASHHRIVEENGTYFDEDGMIHSRKVHIVYGSPRAGKNTYVQNHKEPGDVIIDTDLIINALQGYDERRKDNNMVFLALNVRDHLIYELENRCKDFDCKNVWIVGGFPEKDKREDLAKRLNAELVYIDITQQEARARAIKSDMYKNKSYSAWVVDSWWSKYKK